MIKSRFWSTAATQVLMVALCVIISVPFLVVFFNSLKAKGPASLMELSLPSVFQWDNYAVAIERGRLFTSFLNSMIYAVVGTLGTILVTAPAAFVLSRRAGKTTAFFYPFIALGIMLPTNFVALISVMQFLHLMNSHFGMVVLFIAANVSFSTFIIYGFVGSIPRAMDESAAIDGAKPMRLFFTVILPLLQPVIATVSLLTFIGIWNDFMTPLYVLNSSAAWPLTLSIYSFFGRYSQDWHLVFADVVLTVLPVFVVFLVGQKAIVSGMVSGAVKG